MEKIKYLINKSAFDKVNWFELVLAFILFLVFTWPLLGLLTTVLLFITSLFQKGIPKFDKKLSFFILIPFIIGFIGFLLDLYFFEIKIKHYNRLFPFLMFPTILFANRINFSKFKEYYILFSSGLALFLIFYTLFSTKIFSPTLSSNSIYMDGFLHIIKAHPSYISMYFIITIIFINERINKFKRIALLVLITAVFFSSSKINLIFLFLYAMVFVLKKGTYKYFTYIIFVILLLGILSKLTTNGNNYDPFSRMVVFIDHLKEGSKDDSTNGRIIVWKNAYKLISERPITGYGITYGHDLIQNSPDNNKKHLNAHNQYLQNYLNAGLLGVICLLIYLFHPIIRFWKENTFVSNSIILLFSTNMLVENVLDRQWGIMLVSFFMSLIYIELYQNKSNTEI